MRVLLIQSNDALCKSLNALLESFHYQIDIAENIEDGRYFVGIRHYDLVIMEYEYKDNLATTFIPSIKKTSPKTCVFVIVASASKEAEIQSLRSGADEFLVQPLDFDILIARIDARLKLWGSNSIEIGDLTLLPKEEKVFFQNHEIEIKGKTLEVLTYLALHRGQIVSKEELLDSIWEEPELVTPNVIEVAINQIRQKLDKTFSITSVETIRKKGYRLCYPDSKQNRQ